ncbi:MAG: M48 family metallopeptidase [Oscillospiraceae bacterium]|nr:M48 family metallopeptidase [Oscillospiraceae bacterium]
MPADYKIIRSSRKSISLCVEKDGSIVVRAPYRAPESVIDEFVRSKRDWLEKHLTIVQERNISRDSTVNANVDELPLFGEMAKVVHKAPYGYIDGILYLPDMPLSELVPTVSGLYRRIAKNELVRRTVELSRRFGFSITDVKINSARTHWGSCSGKKSINLSWKLIAAGRDTIDYVIIHELCHTVYMDHSAEFWRLVGKYCPDYEVQRQKLKDVQALLDRYGLDEQKGTT